MASIYSELSRIQGELKAPKNQYNSFGKYHYRSCEDILEGYKQVKGDTSLLLTDSIEVVGDRYYVKATARLLFEDAIIEAFAYAREPLDKKGMDSSQITGAASSYARKYALSGLLAIDDTKDPDTVSGSSSAKTVSPQKTKKVQPKQVLKKDKITDTQRRQLFDKAHAAGRENDDIKNVLSDFGYQSSTDITAKDYPKILSKLTSDLNSTTWVDDPNTGEPTETTF